jgi:hypothetical protein
MYGLYLFLRAHECFCCCENKHGSQTRESKIVEGEDYDFRKRYNVVEIVV